MRSIPKATKDILEVIDMAHSIDNRTEMFQSVCKKLRKLVHFPSAVLLPMYSETGNFRLCDSVGFETSAEGILKFCTYYAPLHPGIARGQLMKYFNSAVRLTDMIPASQLAETEYCRDFQKPLNIFYELCLQPCSRKNLIAGIGLHRARNERDFSDNDKRIVNLLVPHLSNALHNLDMKKEENCSYKTGIVITKTDGQILYMNSEAKNLLKGTPLKMKPMPEHDVSYMLFPSGEGRYRIRIEQTHKSQEGKFVFIELLPSECGLLQKLSELGLTFRQQQIAVLAIQGLSNDEIAEEFSITAQTVKDHMQEVFEKVGVHRRSKLITKILGTQF